MEHRQKAIDLIVSYVRSEVADQTTEGGTGTWHETELEEAIDALTTHIENRVDAAVQHALKARGGLNV
jgi:hypothetical protein